MYIFFKKICILLYCVNIILNNDVLCFKKEKLCVLSSIYLGVHGS